LTVVTNKQRQITTDAGDQTNMTEVPAETVAETIEVIKKTAETIYYI